MTVRYCLALMLCCCSTLAWAAPIRITARSAAIIQEDHITIGDVAKVQGGTPALIAKIERIVLGQSPAPGKERTIHGNYIDTRLKQHGFNGQDFTIRTPPRIRVRRAFQHIESRAIEASVIQAIQANMPWEMQRADIQALRGVKSVYLAPGFLSIDVSFPSNATFLGATPFTVALRVNGNVEHRMYGTALVQVSQDLVITSRPLPRKHLLTESDLQTKRFHLTRLPRRVFSSTADLIGKRTKRPLSAQVMIHAYEVESLPLIQKGDMVVLRVDSPLLNITTMGLAVESGKHGETIRVKNLSSQREVRAVVINEKTVQVPF